jgi:uncharacterized short protein YbdD (DUF466 family)
MKHTLKASFYGLLWATLSLALTTPCSTAVDFEAYRIFTDTSGRGIEARLLSYDPYNGNAALLLKNGKQGTVSIEQFSADDLAFLERWQKAQEFLNNELLEISITFTEGKWEDAGNTNGNREKKEGQFDIYLINHGSSILSKLSIEYCQYQERDGQILVYHNSIPMQDIAPGKTFKTQREFTSLRNSNSGFLNEIVGARFRIMMPVPDDIPLAREVCTPQEWPLDEYPWEDGLKALQQEKSTLPNPMDYPDKEMTDQEIRSIVQQYSDAWEADDYETWKSLMTPMHPGSPALTKARFQAQQTKLKDISIQEIDGRNIKVKLRYKEGSDREGWIQFHSSGHIKYTPLTFQHPVAFTLLNLPRLVHKEENLRTLGYNSFKWTKVPLFDYAPDRDEQENYESVKQILEWIRENGGDYDTTRPKISIPPEQLEEDLKNAETQINMWYRS